MEDKQVIETMQFVEATHVIKSAKLIVAIEDKKKVI